MKIRGEHLKSGSRDVLGDEHEYPEGSELFSVDSITLETDSPALDDGPHTKPPSSELSRAVKKNGKYKQYSDDTKDQFIELITERGMNANQAAKALGIPVQTAYSWKRKWNESIVRAVLQLPPEELKKPGPKPSLTEVHGTFLKGLIGKDSKISLREMREALEEEFGKVKANESTIQKFITPKAEITLKRISRYPERRALRQMTEERLEWAHKWKDELDYLENAVFIDEAGFNVNLRREYGWTKKSGEAITNIPLRAGTNISLLGAICSKGLISLQSRKVLLDTNSTRKRLDPGENVGELKMHTSDDSFFDFMRSVINQLQTSSDFSNLKYLVLEDAPSHKREDLKLLVEGTGYEFIFLPQHTPELNPINLLWSTMEDNIKLESLTREDHLSDKIREIASELPEEFYRKWCRKSADYLNSTLSKTFDSSRTRLTSPEDIE